ncbi:MAG: phenylalanine--tRNA ligase subunit beta [Acidobacteria bacterium]|nr:phenylalanine--tRNA ligase subunit beta [Acidobacteriota bacterium]
MKVLLSWVREFVDIDETAEAIGRRLSLRGLALEGLDHLPQNTARPGGGTDAGGDWLLDFDVTANRPDCLSVAGVAREIATVYGLPFREPAQRWPAAGRGAAPDPRDIADPTGLLGWPIAGTEPALAVPVTPVAPTPAVGGALPISIHAPDLCARYVGALADVTIGPSPAWITERLTACGVRPISNIVDITNYVLLEVGHPMHAFDYTTLAGPAIVVRQAREGETLTTLDGKARTLTTDMLVIADAERPTALGGVMGGADSEVTSTTRRIVFEAAWFKPQMVRATAKALGLRTEASMRFERGADVTAPPVAMTRALALVEELGAGTAVGGMIDVYPQPRVPRTIALDRDRISGLLGMTVPDAEVTRILTSLGFGVDAAAHGWLVTPPAWRVDQHRGVDLIEEVGRHYGFEHLPATFPGVQQAPAASDPRIARDTRARRVALARGFSEAISFAFIEAAAAAPFTGTDAPVALANPLSEKFAVMRPSLLPGLIQAVSHNRRHGRRDIQLFEIGTRFSPRGESRVLALAWTGLATPDHWSGARRDVDFFDMSGAVEQIASVFDRVLTPVVPEPGTVAASVLVPGRAATLLLNDVAVGFAGQLDAAIADAHDVPANDVIYVAEVDLDALSGGDTSQRHATSLPRFPAAVRDVALLVDDALSAATVRGTIQAHAPAALVSVVEFDRYQGKGIPEGKVSLALRLTFQSAERTLTDAEVEAATSAVVQVLSSQLGAVRR